MTNHMVEGIGAWVIIQGPPNAKPSPCPPYTHPQPPSPPPKRSLTIEPNCCSLSAPLPSNWIVAPLCSQPHPAPPACPHQYRCQPRPPKAPTPPPKYYNPIAPAPLALKSHHHPHTLPQPAPLSCPHQSHFQHQCPAPTPTPQKPLPLKPHPPLTLGVEVLIVLLTLRLSLHRPHACINLISHIDALTRPQGTLPGAAQVLNPDLARIDELKEALPLRAVDVAELELLGGGKGRRGRGGGDEGWGPWVDELEEPLPFCLVDAAELEPLRGGREGGRGKGGDGG